MFTSFLECLISKACNSASFNPILFKFEHDLVKDIDCPYLEARIIWMCFLSVASVQSHFYLHSKKCAIRSRHFKREYLGFPWADSAELSGGDPTSRQWVAVQISSQSAQAFARNRTRVRALSGPRKCVDNSSSAIDCSAHSAPILLRFGEDVCVHVLCTHTEFHRNPSSRLEDIPRGFVTSHVSWITQQNATSWSYLKP